MSFIASNTHGLDYCPCHYSGSRAKFRGPKSNLNQPYIAFLGGAETYGRNIGNPFPSLVEDAIGATCVNFGTPNAGLDFYLKNPEILNLAEKAQVVVLQILGVQNMSNRYYSVHPRRNDRFLQASEVLKGIYPDVDFTEFHFNRHMLSKLSECGEQRFARVKRELCIAWVARMKYMLGRFSGRAVLVWFASHSPDEWLPDDLTLDPLFVDREMIDELRPSVARFIELQAPPLGFDLLSDRSQKSPLKMRSSEVVLGPAAHEDLAQHLAEALPKLL